MRTSLKITIATIIAILVISIVSLVSTITIALDQQSNSASQSRTLDIMSLEINDVPAQSRFETELAYPIAWLAVPADGVPIELGMPVEVMYAPDMDIRPHKAGLETDGALLPADPSKAVVRLGDTSYDIDPNALLVNVADLIPSAICDIRYAYDTPSKSGGNDIEGLTGEILPNYAASEQFDPYIGRDSRPAPVAYKSAVKLVRAAQELEQRGYRLVVWDAYRPYSASRYISEKFTAAYNSNPAIRESVGGQWGLDWYAADGTSGHNYGTDIDVSLADMDGNPIPMPSDFDAFDESAHLTEIPMNYASISPDKYSQPIRDNIACAALHEALVSAGFSELASEWWHFADKDTENEMRMIVGNSGLDFEAKIS